MYMLDRVLGQTPAQIPKREKGHPWRTHGDAP